jgi:hypothetical protein
MWWTVDSLALPQDVFGLAKEMHEQMSLLNAEWNTLDTFFFHPLIWNDTWWYSDIWNALFESPTIISIRNLCSENLNWPVFLVHSDALFKAYAPRQVCTLMAGEIGPAETAAFNLVSWWQFIWLRCLRSKSWEQSWSHITKNTWDESILDIMFSAEKSLSMQVIFVALNYCPLNFVSTSGFKTSRSSETSNHHICWTNCFF